jgi:hypothetical protein
MAADDDNFLRDLLGKLAEAAKNYALPKIPSQTLRGSIFTQVDSRTTAFVEIPEYWAAYLHDGRGAFGPSVAKVLVYFGNPKNDPRLVNGVSPQRLSQVRPLSIGQFKFWLNRNRQARAVGALPPMIIRKRVGPMRGSFFFDNDKGMSGFSQEADLVAGPVADAFVASKLRGVGSRRDSVVTGLGV